MSEQFPEVVAADLSPLSPSPLHTSSLEVVPSLQDHADSLDNCLGISLDNSLDGVSLNSLTAARHPVATMASNAQPGPVEMPDILLVDGDDASNESQVESVADDDSFDAYGEDDDGQEQKKSDADNDDYARTFDSPARPQHEQENNGQGIDIELDPQPDVSMASESIITSSPAPDTLTSQSPASASASAAAAASSAPAPVPTSHSSPSPELFHPASSTQNHPSLTENSTEPSDVLGTTAAAAATTEEAPLPEPVATTVDDHSPKPSPATADAGESAPASVGDDDSAVDIQKLVDDITARAAASSTSTSIPPQSGSPPPTSQLPLSSSLNVSQPASLPPRPTLAHQPGQPISRPEDYHPFQLQTPNAHAPPASGPPGVPTTPQAVPPGTYMAAGPPGTNGDAMSSLPPPPSASFNAPQSFTSLAPGQPTSPPAGISAADTHHFQAQQTWETYQADEKRYLTEAKWERFPDGSRIFIGNLSSERVSKREVFDLFHQFGRLAQISLKSAYGFVQYHTVTDAQAAMQHAQDAILGGRKIHLEYSRAQKKKDDKERSPDRRTQRADRGGRSERGDRGDRGGRGADRYDGRDQGRRGRDDYRPGRSPSPRRADAYGRDRGHQSSFDRSSRARSRSPNRYGRSSEDQYRRRSPSPHRHGHSDGDQLDIPRRYGDQIPDVQLLLLQEVERDFVAWVQRAFADRGLRSDVMFLNPRFPRKAVLQRQVLEGVHGVIELDVHAQSTGKIPLQVFDRSRGINNVHFDQYQDLDPNIAVELVLRAKTQAAPQPPQPGPPAYAPNQYGSQAYPYAGQQPAGYPYQAPHQPAPAAHNQAPAQGQDVASVVGQLDNTSLQALLASLQAQQQNPAYAAMPSTAYPPQANAAAYAQNSQIDINALLGNLNAAGALPSGTPNMSGYPTTQPYHAASHPISPTAGGHPPPAPNGGDTAQQVQNIMATLARYRQ